jgi:hypothetical protein
VIEESNSGAKKNRRDVDVDFVQEASIQQWLAGVSAVDSYGLSGGGGFGLVHGAFDAVGHECTAELGRGHPAVFASRLRCVITFVSVMPFAVAEPATWYSMLS